MFYACIAIYTLKDKYLSLCFSFELIAFSMLCGAPAMCILRKSKAVLAVPAWSDGVLGLALLWPFSLVCKIKQQW